MKKSPSQISPGPGSKPASHVHLKLPTVFLHVPFPHIARDLHSSMSESRKHLKVLQKQESNSDENSKSNI